MSSNLLEIKFYPTIDTVYCTWSGATNEAKWEDIKAEMIRLADFLDANKPQFILIDNRKMFFPIDPENQIWVDNNIAVKSVDNPNAKMAFVESEDIIVQLSLEQMMEEDHLKNSKYRHFSTIEAADAWLRAK